MTEMRGAVQNDRAVRWRLLLAALLPAAVFALLAATASAAPHDTVDRRIEEAVHRFALRHRPAADAARVLTYLGNTAVLAVLVVAGALLLLRHGRRRSAGFVLVVPALGWAVQNLIKDVIERPRPVFVHAIAHAPGWSFPSGHATDSTAAYGALALAVAVSRIARRLAAAAATLLVTVVCTTRVVLGVHWLSDVLGGALLGITVLTVASAVRPPSATRM
jgi:undecaprenyl-diphosphatase